MAKKTKKYLNTRKELADHVQQLINGISELNTYETSPSDIAQELNAVMNDLHDLRDKLTDEAL